MLVHAIETCCLLTYRSIAAIIVIRVIQTAGDLVVDFLVILLGGNEGALSRGICAVQIEIGTSTTGSEETQEDGSVAGLGGASFRGIATTRGGTEGLGREGETGRTSGRSEGGGSGS